MALFLFGSTLVLLPAAMVQRSRGELWGSHFPDVAAALFCAVFQDVPPKALLCLPLGQQGPTHLLCQTEGAAACLCAAGPPSERRLAGFRPARVPGGPRGLRGLLAGSLATPRMLRLRGAAARLARCPRGSLPALL